MNAMTKQDLPRVGYLIQCQIWSVGLGAMLLNQEWLWSIGMLAGAAWFGWCAYDGLPDEQADNQPEAK